MYPKCSNFYSKTPNSHTIPLNNVADLHTYSKWYETPGGIQRNLEEYLAYSNLILSTALEKNNKVTVLGGRMLAWV